MDEERKSPENDDYRKQPIPSAKLWEALKATLDVFGPAMKEATLSELQKGGLDPAEGIKELTIAESGERLASIFGKDGTEVILLQLSKRLDALEK